MHCLDDALLPATVANRPTCRRQTTGQGGLADEATRPQALEQFLLGDDPVAVLEKIGQDIEHLRLELDELAGIAQLVAL